MFRCSAGYAISSASTAHASSSLSIHLSMFLGGWIMDFRDQTGSGGFRLLGEIRAGPAQYPMSASPPKADMCGALAHVCFGPEAKGAGSSDTLMRPACEAGP